MPNLLDRQTMYLIRPNIGSQFIDFGHAQCECTSEAGEIVAVQFDATRRLNRPQGSIQIGRVSAILTA